MLGDHVELLFHRQRDLDRTTDDHGERGDQSFELDVELAAEAAAEIGHLDPDFVLRPAEQPGDLNANEGRRLVGGVNGQAIVARLGHRDERLERHMQALLGLEGVLEHMRGAGHRLVDIAAAQVIIERDVGAAAAFEMFQIGKSAGRAQHVVHQNIRRHRLDLVIDRRKFFIFR